MTTEQLIELKRLAECVINLNKSVDAARIHAEFIRPDSSGPVVLTANREGMIYFAAIMLGLAIDSSDGQHFHFDTNTVLSRCDLDLVIKYQK